MSDYKTKLTLYGIVRVTKKMCRFYMCRSRIAKKIIAGNISHGIPFPKKTVGYRKCRIIKSRIIEN